MKKTIETIAVYTTTDGQKFLSRADAGRHVENRIREESMILSGLISPHGAASRGIAEGLIQHRDALARFVELAAELEAKVEFLEGELYGP